MSEAESLKGNESPVTNDTPQRIMFIDMLRGAAIYFVAIAHSFIYPVFGGVGVLLDKVPQSVVVALMPLALVMTWAAAFAGISGCATAYVILTGFRRGRTRKSAMRSVLSSFLILMCLHVLFLQLLTHVIDDGTGAVKYSIITGISP
ncbi:hypothetical protein KIPB_008428 [Kipferlia bialata]|uniref:Uncharacterized protein n=1 Tax=Kipferlia bialata TaxID=797122 RepID=A0A9K3CZZ6_9EUKA|nr:hypothetical protein KIPB_008428 [Kipferlia bialata]|eukprot:g8428.t1